jgi:uncharacterized membrane protein
MNVTRSDLPDRSASLVAGAGILVLAVLAAFVNFIVLGNLVTPGDAVATSGDIRAAEGLFRVAVVSLYVVVVLDIVVAAALYRVLAPAGRKLAALAAGLRIAYAGVFLVAIVQLSAVLPLQADAAVTLGRIETFQQIWDVSYVLFGAHLLLTGYLAYRSGYVPRVIALLVAVNGLGYLLDVVGAPLGWSFSFGEVTFVGEVALMGWLLVHGVRGGRRAAGAPVDPSRLPVGS